jgi:acyl carrier protein
MSASIKSEDRLRQTVAEVLGVNPYLLSEESSPSTVSSWDSLGHLNLVIALEEEFEVNLSAEEVLAMRNMGTIRRILHQYGVEI